MNFRFEMAKNYLIRNDKDFFKKDNEFFNQKWQRIFQLEIVGNFLITNGKISNIRNGKEFFNSKLHRIF